jgi:hypothetical protein
MLCDTGDEMSERNTYSCHAIDTVSHLIGQEELARKLKNDIQKILQNQVLTGFLRSSLGIPMIVASAQSLPQRKFIQFLRLKFMEMLIEKYELEGN